MPKLLYAAILSAWLSLAIAARPLPAYPLNVVPPDEAIQALIQRSHSGATIHVPAGTYVVREPIDLKDGVRIVGAGMGKTILRIPPESTGSAIRIENCHDSTVSDLTIDGGNAAVSQWIYAYNSRQISIIRVEVRDLAQRGDNSVHAIHFNGDGKGHGVTDSVIQDCRIANIGPGAVFGCGIRMSWGSSRNRVIGCEIRNTGRGGIFGDNGSTDLVIAGTTVAGSGGEKLGIEVWRGCDRCIIEDNKIDHWLSIGGCDRCSVRRNIISAKDGTFGFIGLEVIGSRCVVTDNLVDDGQVIGLSLSNTPQMRYVYHARNTIKACSEWGAQFQGEAGGIDYQYLYRCKFVGTTRGRGVMPYPADAGFGFRVNGNTHHVVFDECEFSENARGGIQVTTPDSGSWLFQNCRFLYNGGPVFSGPALDSPVEWRTPKIRGNADNLFPASRALPGEAPSVKIRGPETARAGELLRFHRVWSDPSGTPASSLWDFGSGIPGEGDAPEITYAKPGLYRITLIVWNANGRASRSEQRILVSK